MIKTLLTLLAFFTLIAPAHAALDGWDNVPGDACAPSEEGHTRRNASANLDGSEITLICDGAVWQSAGGGGLAALQGQDDTGPCTVEKNGLIRYRDSADPHWEYCHGGTTSWLPFRLPQCADDDTGECTLGALRTSSDPQFKASSIRCGDNILGVTGTHGSGSSSAFTFTNATNAALSTLTTASAVTISGIPAGCPGAVEVSGQGSPQISIAGGAWGTSGSITNGQTLAVRLTSSGSFSTAHTATVSIGSTDSVWSVTTLAADTTPNAFDFTPNVTNAALSTLTTASAVTITGINASTPVSVTGTGAQISINGGAWVTSGNITNGQSLGLRLTSSASFSTGITATVTVGGVTDTWSVTTLGADTTPNAFTFTDLTGQALNTQLASTAITISGINTTTPVSVSGDGSPQIRINGGSWVTSGNILNGQTLEVRLTSANAFSTERSATIDVGGVTDNWSVTTLAADTTPNAFDFTPNVTGAALNTVVMAANTVTITGINASTPVSVAGTGTPEISINSGAWVTSGNITNGQTLRVRVTSAGTNSTVRSATVNVGGVTDVWSVTTVAGAPVRVFLTTAGAGSWTVPANWNSANNTIEVIGAGGCGTQASSGSGGGGGGAYSRINNLTLTPGASISYSVGAGVGNYTNGNPSWFNGTGLGSASVSADGGKRGGPGSATGGAGGLASSGKGTTKYSGGNGGNGRGNGSDDDSAAGGGGGAAGPLGAGRNGASGGLSPCNSKVNGSGGGNGGGSDGACAGPGGNNAQGTGGGAYGAPPASGSHGTNGGGGGGTRNANGGNGGNGIEWVTHGSGGGGGGASDGTGDTGGRGGLFGGGCGGGRIVQQSGQGIIVITYTP